MGAEILTLIQPIFTQERERERGREKKRKKIKSEGENNKETLFRLGLPLRWIFSYLPPSSSLVVVFLGVA